jgi:hypothetical protein
MRRSTIILIAAVAIAWAMAAAFPAGCRNSGKAPTSAPAGLVQISLVVSPHPSKFSSTQFLFAIDIRYRLSELTRFGWPRHRLDLVVRDQEGKEVPPAVQRPWADQIMDVEMCGTGDYRAYLNVRQPNEGRFIDKVNYLYGRHTLDILTKAWDLKPGRYTLHARYFLDKSITTTAPEPHGRYWDCDLSLPPVQIDVTADVTTWPATID